MSLDLLIAFVLTTAPDAPPCDRPPCPLASMQAVALRLEVMDPREQRHLFARPEDFAADLRVVRRRYDTLADAPPLSDAERFPERLAIAGLLSFNRSYRQNLEDRAALYPADADEYREAIAETDYLYSVWDKARDARCDYFYVTVRRQALKKLREEIGPQAYYSGCLPPHVPIWRFRVIGD